MRKAATITRDLRKAQLALATTERFVFLIVEDSSRFTLGHMLASYPQHILVEDYHSALARVVDLRAELRTAEGY